MADINTFGNPTYFNSDVTFYKNISLSGNLKTDNLVLKKLTAEVSVTSPVFYGDGSNLTGIGSLTAAVEQIDYTCTNPITTLGNTIKISEDSNAYGTRHVESGTPSSSDGCDGDIWYSTTGTFLGSVPVGAVFHFASSSAPTGYLKANGDTVPNGSGTVQGVTADFSALYAILGSTYGSAGQLPDLRAEFIRGWDDGRQVDPDHATRTFGSSQSWAIQNITGSIARIAETFIQASFSATSALYKSSNNPSSGLTPNQPDTSQSGTLAFDASRNVQTSTETRPRNVALLACIKY